MIIFSLSKTRIFAKMFARLKRIGCEESVDKFKYKDYKIYLPLQNKINYFYVFKELSSGFNKRRRKESNLFYAK